MAWQHTLKARWAALGLREQRGLTLAATVLMAALVWSLALAPAWRTLQGADAQNAQLGASAERLQALQARARMLQARPALAPAEVLKTLQGATLALGQAASLQVVGEVATVTLRQVGAATLAPWLAPQAGSSPKPAEVHLRRAAGSAEPLWSGTLVFRLPPAPVATP
jgi:general secretion pathway protein M